MKYTVLTLFPAIIDAFFSASIIAKAVKRGIIEYRSLDIRDFALDKHKTCDDAPYGGGPGMLMLPEPLGRALEAAGVVKKDDRRCSGGAAGAAAPVVGGGGRPPHGGLEPEGRLPPSFPRTVYLSPSGRPFNQDLARELAAEPELVLLCGRYEGIDQRIIDLYIDDEISVGDYVLSSGEAAALAVIDATYRLVDGVIAAESLEEETFSDGLLEYPQFTRPDIYDILRVPGVLLSGHHENIRRWRLEKRVEKTLRNRPDLIQRGRERGLFNGETNSIIDRQVAALEFIDSRLADRRSGTDSEGDVTK
ncbi:MAG: tRNA (guanosine(37)-N1)-methyltransferase TrmD [Treponema sp.]|jgi:tRNA (guanine37-N1)-methyltransferase|nr:tRNA (guanosine(37)-N1)-methyltransferase TrmD [Treponema sp.]